MGSFINVTDVDLLGGVFNTPGSSSVQQTGSTSGSDDRFNQSTDVAERFQPLSEVGGELIQRFTQINRLEGEIDARQQAQQRLSELQSLLEDPTKENLAAAEDIRNELNQLSFTDQDGQTQRVLNEDELNRLRFDIPGETLDRLGELINSNDEQLEESQVELAEQENDLQRFIENQGLQTGETFTQQGDVVLSFLNVENTGQLLDILI